MFKNTESEDSESVGLESVGPGSLGLGLLSLQAGESAFLKQQQQQKKLLGADVRATFLNSNERIEFCHHKSKRIALMTPFANICILSS